MSGLGDAGFAGPAFADNLALPGAGFWARTRIALLYLLRHQRLASFTEPKRFTELVQRRKLSGRDQRTVMLADKQSAKVHVAGMLGSEWAIPTYWQGTELPPTPWWPTPFVLKSRHGCNQNIFFRDDLSGWAAARRRTQGWLRRPYGVWLDEWAYADIERGLMIEPFVGKEGRLPVDYKFYVFGGRATHVQVHLDREGRHRWILLDRNWHRVSASTADPDPLPPASLAEMIAAAEKLAQGLDFVRVDLYEIGGRPLFGEMTFYPGSGLDKFHPVSLDAELGQYWLDAGGR